MSSSGQGSRSPSASASNASPSSPAEKQAPMSSQPQSDKPEHEGNTEKAETQKAIDKEEADKKKERHGKMVDDLHDRVDLAFKSGLLCILHVGAAAAAAGECDLSGGKTKEC
ncbi:hypothetical protein PG985_009062 [Apiospora marii]|uniref:uncharacterized protein n=1 Tax=Apiospora marii TaxID=335849 RepID=UPI0031305067